MTERSITPVRCYQNRMSAPRACSLCRAHRLLATLFRANGAPKAGAQSNRHSGVESMAKKSRAFRKGILLGSLAGAGIILWNAPQPGWKSREQVLEAFEGLLFKLLDIPGKIVDEQVEPLTDSVVASKRPDQVNPESPLPADIVLDARPAELSV